MTSRTMDLMRALTLFAAVFAFSVCLAQVQPKPPNDALAKQAIDSSVRQKLFDWFDTLGYGPAVDAPIVSSASIAPRWEGLKQPSKLGYGFVLRSDPDSITVLNTQLPAKAGSLVIGGPSEPTYHVVDFRPWAEGEIKRLSMPRKDDWDGSFVLFGGQLTVEGYEFLLARACYGREFSELGGPFLELFRNELPVGSIDEEVILSRLQHGFGSVAYERTMQSFCDPKMSRPAIAAELQNFLVQYPGSNAIGGATDILQQLRLTPA